jgi:LacI family transcriptional regulator
MAAASVRDVALRAGVSVGTVSNVLNRPDKVTAETVARVMGAIDDLGFIRNDAARQLRAGHSKTVGLVVLDVRNPFFTDVARGAEDEAASAGLTVILGNSDENSDREAAYLDLFEEQRVHGVLISPYGDITARLERLRQRGIQAVLVDRSSGDASFSSVSVDDLAGDRLAGARLAVAAHPGTELETVLVEALSVLAGRAAGVEIAARPAAERPDAIFAANDLVAMGVLQALMMQHSDINVPRDISLIGYDDIDFASAAVVPLSSIRQPSTLIGHTAVEILLEQTADPTTPPRQVVFEPELVVRESSRPLA